MTGTTDELSEGRDAEAPVRDYPRWSGTFRARAADLGADGRVGAATVLGFFQEGAAVHARQLGVGLQELHAEGRTWMLARMSVCFDGWPTLDEPLTVTTWPVGIRGRAIVCRDYEARGEAGQVVATAASEWVVVETERGRIARPSPAILALAPPGTPRVALSVAGADLPPANDWTAAWQTELPVRRADLDVNRHVNNVHYVDWLFEALPDEWLERRLARIDIAYRLGAVHGDTVVSAAAPTQAGALAHRLTRRSDGAILADAATVWA